jgi:glycosyltransferase involved in cell wall biosynthesis
MHKFMLQGNQVHHFDTLHRPNLIKYVASLAWFFIRTMPDIVYYHTVDLNSRLIEFRMLVALKKIMRFHFVIVEHNCRHLYDRSREYKTAFNRLMCSVDHLVLIGDATKKSYQDNQIIMPGCTSVEAAFLPPDEGQEQHIIGTYPLQLKSFIQSHSFIITVNAFQLALFEGKDLYGIDQCIELLRMLGDKNAGLIIVLGQVGNAEHYQLLQERIERYGLAEQCLWIIGQKELWPILKQSDVFVRPTLSDAESVSVQEALYFKVPVVASDVCIRPRGVLTFKRGNSEDFHAKTNQLRDHLHA